MDADDDKTTQSHHRRDRHNKHFRNDKQLTAKLGTYLNLRVFATQQDQLRNKDYCYGMMKKMNKYFLVNKKFK